VRRDLPGAIAALVVHDEGGVIYTVRYEAVNAMLLNEFIKEQRKGEEQGHKGGGP